MQVTLAEQERYALLLDCAALQMALPEVEKHNLPLICVPMQMTLPEEERYNMRATEAHKQHGELPQLLLLLQQGNPGGAGGGLARFANLALSLLAMNADWRQQDSEDFSLLAKRALLFFPVGLTNSSSHISVAAAHVSDLLDVAESCRIRRLDLRFLTYWMWLNRLLFDGLDPPLLFTSSVSTLYSELYAQSYKAHCVRRHREKYANSKGPSCALTLCSELCAQSCRACYLISPNLA